MKLKIENNNYLIIEAIYDKDKFNFWTYTKQTRGIYVYFTPKIIENNWSTTTIGAKGSFKILIKELNRGSQKQLKLVNQYLESIKELLFEAWKAKDYNTCISLIKAYKN